MKTVVTLWLALALTGSAWGQKAQTGTRRKSDADDVTQQLKALAEQVRAQQEQIQRLQEQIQQRDQQWQSVQQQLQQSQSNAATLESKVAEAASASADQQRMYKQLEGNVNDISNNFTAALAQTQEEQKRTSAIESLAKRLRWTGDIRVRQEDFLLPGQNPRVRERIRLRLGIEGDLSDDFVGGIAIASGTYADPTSTNQTLTDFFERKPIGFDRGYITYNPKAHKWLNLTGGKFAYTWQRTNQTLDPDLNPDGFSEKLSFDLANPYLKNITLNGMQLFFFENSATRHGVNGTDSFAAGGQIAAKLVLGKRWTMSPSYTALNWRNTDILLNSPAFDAGFTVTGSTTIVCTPVTTLGTAPSCGFPTAPAAANGMTNAYTITAAAPNGVLTRSFLSKFLYSDVILDNTIATGHERWPWRVLLEYEDNLRAVAPAPGRSPQSHSYLAETSIGQTKNKGDWLFGYAFLRQEQDSVLSSFNESDQRVPTNVLQHRAYAQYKVAPKVTAAGTLWVGRVLDTSLFAGVPNPFGAPGTLDRLQTNFLAPGVTPGTADRYLRRFQFDVIYSF